MVQNIISLTVSCEVCDCGLLRGDFGELKTICLSLAKQSESSSCYINKQTPKGIQPLYDSQTEMEFFVTSKNLQQRSKDVP